MSVRRSLEHLGKPVLTPMVASAGLCRAMVATTAMIMLGALWGIPLWQCPLLGATGVPCPGCGLTRSVALLVRGDFVGAVRQHAFGPVALCGWGVFAVSAGATPRVRERICLWLGEFEGRTKVVQILLVLLLLCWIAGFV